MNINCLQNHQLTGTRTTVSSADARGADASSSGRTADTEDEALQEARREIKRLREQVRRLKKPKTKEDSFKQKK